MLEKHNDLVGQFRKARNAGTPLISISSFDPEATMSAIQQSMPGAIDTKGDDTSFSSGGTRPIPIIQWDIINGWRSRNKAGREAIEESNIDIDVTINPVQSLIEALKLPDYTMLFVLNAHHFIEKPDFCQALWNLRDEFKADAKSIILVGPEIVFPTQLQQDVLVLDEPLPSDFELKQIVEEVMENVEIKITKEDLNASVDALRGIAAFPAEQSVAMNVSKKGLDITGLWDRKRQLISSTPGLRVYSGDEKFNDIGGCDQIKQFFTGVINGREAPNVIVFIDEGEKMFAGSSSDVGDSTGVSQDFLGTTLSYMEDNECDGAILVGPPGAAKSAIAKATGNEAGVPTIILDLGGMKGSLVGQSETQLRNALKVITAVGGGRAYFIMTCNKIASLPPELRRRFTSGIFFFDLPSAAEQQKIWAIYCKKYDIDESQVAAVNYQGWTGAEIRNCCRMAYRQQITLEQASRFIVPVSVSAAAQIDGLRRQASGAYLSANDIGIYHYDDPNDPVMAKAVNERKRKVNIG